MLRLALCGLAVVVGIVGGAALAGTERYDYDALGRLVRVIDEQGRVTEYVYDPAGNILRVTVSGPGSSQPPFAATVSPTQIRRGETLSFVITGTGLTGARVSVSDPALEITSLQSSDTQVTFDLTVLATAPLGTHTFSIANAGGAASAEVVVNPVLPVLNLDPAPIAIAIGTAKDFNVSLSNEDNIEHVVSVTSSDPAVLTVAPASLTFAPGQTQATVTVTPVATGRTTVSLSATGLATLTIEAGVGETLLGQSASVTPPVSVHLRAATPGAPPGNGMSATQAISVHLPAVTPGAPAGNAMSVTPPVSVHLPAVTPGAPAGNAMSASEPVSVSMP